MNNKIRKLRQLLNKKINCWSCYECCGVIIFSKEEKKAMNTVLLKKWIKSPPNWKGEKYCEYLDKDWKCSVYEQRPIICRGFWLVNHEALKCPIWKHTDHIAEPREMVQYRNSVLKDWVMNKNADYILWAILPPKDQLWAD